MPHLLIIDKDRKGQDVRTLLPADRPMTVGRSAASSLRIRDAKLSRVHYEISVVDGVATLKDLDSMNGTHVNGERIKATQLRHGDLILAGYTQFRYMEREEEPPAPKPKPKPKPKAKKAASKGAASPKRAAGPKGAAAKSKRPGTAARKKSSAKKTARGTGETTDERPGRRAAARPKLARKGGPERRRTRKGDTSRAGKSTGDAKGGTSTEQTQPAPELDDAGIATLYGITADGPGRALKKNEAVCASCRQPVAQKEVRTGQATDVHGQVCCVACRAADSLLGKTVAGHRIDVKLGGGAWSATYKAEQISMARSVVFRAIRSEVMANAELSTRFLAEVKRGGQISHPNLVRIYDIGRTAKRCYVSVEYIDGSSVRRSLAKKPGFAVKEAVRIVAEIAGAVDAAHRRDVLHLDIRPSLVLINDERIPKLAGLGFAKVLEDAVAAGAINVEHPADNVAYWAPECLTDRAGAGKRADVYSLGAVLYAMLAGRSPFEESDPVKLVGMVRNARPDPLGQVRKDIPQRVGAIVAKAMAKTPRDRYQSCQFLARDLRSSLAK